jgi:murein DD-endopeptidase MepM/ murein hydrolase activator NlpD
MEEDYNKISTQFNRVIAVALRLILPFVFSSGVVILIGVFLFFTVLGVFKSKQNEALGQSVLAANGYNLSPVLEQNFLDLGGLKYGEPLLENLSKTEKLALQIIRIGEWETRLDSSLDGDRDSCGPYQQRLYELGNNANPLGKKTQEILKESYPAIFHASRLELLKKYYNLNIRKGLALTSGYGPRSILGLDFHYGLDYGYDNNFPVSVVEDGQVIEVAKDLLGGNTVIIRHEKKNLQSLYAHLDKVLVKKGDQVFQGGIIAESGNTGLATTGSHLHFQLKKDIESGWNSDTIDPNTQVFYLNLIKTPFLNMCLQLTKVHLATGFFDAIALQRLQEESSTKPWLTKEINSENFSLFVSSLCQSQRPVSCPIWEARVKSILPFS